MFLFYHICDLRTTLRSKVEARWSTAERCTKAVAPRMKANYVRTDCHFPLSTCPQINSLCRKVATLFYDYV